MRRLLALVASVLALGLALAFAPASHAQHVVHRDPPMMSMSEFNANNPGQTKAKVESNCGGCTAVNSGFSDPVNGNTYKAWEFLTGPGNAFVDFRFNGTNWIVGHREFWCAYQPPLDIPSMDCNPIVDWSN